MTTRDDLKHAVGVYCDAVFRGSIALQSGMTIEEATKHIMSNVDTYCDKVAEERVEEAMLESNCSEKANSSSCSEIPNKSQTNGELVGGAK